MAPPEDHPSAAVALADDCVLAVKRSIGIDLDFSPETLPILDHYCAGLERAPEALEHASRVVGAYFGEVVRRRFGCRWHFTSAGSMLWRLEFERCYLYFNPIGVALELLLGGDVPGSNAVFVTWPDAAEGLLAVLDRMPPVSEDDYYRLTIRFEVLEAVVDFLMAHKDDKQPETFDASFYARQVELEQG